MSFGIRYYRDEVTARRYSEHAPQLLREVGWCMGRNRFTTQGEAQKLANHPAVPAYVQPSNDPPTVQMFRTMTRRT